VKTEYGVYLVTGKREYRGHAPGTVFEAVLDPGPVRRAIDRGDIKLLRYVTPSLAPGSYRLPPDWLEPEAASIEAPSGASLVSEEGRR
jgi:hypothetical protein